MERTYHLLLVEDDEADRRAVRRALWSAGLRVEMSEAVTGRDALALLSQDAFDCVLIDCQLPDGEGISVLRAAQERAIRTPFVMLTGEGGEQAASALMQAGAADYIPKSGLAADALARAVRSVVRTYEAEQKLLRNQAHIEALNQRLERAMTETHHRVKNNLQVIAAMLDMWLMEGCDSIAAKNLKQLGMYIHVMAVVHEILTEQAKLDAQAQQIDAREVLERLLPMLGRIAGGRTLKIDLQEAWMTAGQGTSLALVANELVSNALKHGRGTVGVSLWVEEGEALLEVCDEGPGFPPDFNASGAACTGLDMVQHLSRWDLGGSVSCRNVPAGGACVRVTAPLDRECLEKGSRFFADR